MQDDINKYRIFNKLKSVYRAASVDNRKESSAEHSWGCLILADFFLSKIDQKIDRLRVYELLMYHDVVEIESGDMPINLNLSDAHKKDLEHNGAKKLAEKMPNVLAEKFRAMFSEFENQKTVESRFARAIDVLDAEIHELDYKQDFKGWTEEFIREKKAALFEEFPALKEVFNEVLEYMTKEGYFEN